MIETKWQKPRKSTKQIVKDMKSLPDRQGANRESREGLRGGAETPPHM